MIRLRHLSGSLEGKTMQLSKKALRLGRADDCDVRFDSKKDPKVSGHHAELLFEDGEWIVIDTGSTNGTLVNGRRITKQKLSPGDKLQIGSGGPTVAVEFETSAVKKPAAMDNKTQAVSMTEIVRLSDNRFDKTEELSAISSDLKANADTQTASLAELAAKKVALARAQSHGLPSGQTMMIMADTLKQVQQGTQAKTKKKWEKIVAVVGGVALVIVVVLGTVIFVQKRQLDALVAEKGKIDAEIVKIEKQMETEEDPEKLDALEAKLALLSGRAEDAIKTIAKKNKKKAAEVEEAGDEMDKEIRRILKSFDATTYAVPPVFKERLTYHVDKLGKDAYRKRVYRRKMEYWPLILPAFQEKGLPEEMAYIAWVESQFDPEAKSSAGARGLWQFTASTAKSFGLRVDKQVDERTDPEKATRAAAKYLAGLLAEFGSDSFMLAMAAYNKGESGVRRVLRQIAQEKDGFRKEKREFWHLYRLKKLPEETREYVPKILAAAIVARNPQKYGLD